MALELDRSAIPGTRRQSTHPKAQLLFGLAVDGLRMGEAVERCRLAIQTRRPLLIGVLNAAKIVNLRHDPYLRDALLDCNMLLADGQSVVWASWLLHKPLPERVAGIDLFEALLDLAHRDGRSVYLLGAKPEVLAALEKNVHQRWAGLRTVGRHDGYFSDAQASDIAADIRASGADMLFLGMASPKKEIFLQRFQRELDVPVLHGVGGSFDILAGLTQRAPLAWRRLGMEWAYRLAQEPRRMWKRYLVTNVGFVALTLREVFSPSPRLEPTSRSRVSKPPKIDQS
ncbi:MAG: WecB/TagA/CpsF family glycosyltransferase [Alphaproteobacteria bacterium]|nr:WecB/TagA/CpsF family glycosyltransferase [Alphaproteobacteria bacterium]MBU1561617.1 WecB/TagA/CpsF family glycosyltransferase [Alphaproteobacteria bacterium]MBU2302402.1 WecB/TagA/CpsF family glycosyltransferase [Alphaproteobacteria bacterium]MBU2368682.1 WecB/TagA/CpsF family glycosyltransferase [Alphaproteobacteria bacterium]